MRRVGLAAILAGITLAGCGGFREVFTSRSGTAARVGSMELKSERVAEIINRLGGPNANPEAAELVTWIWADMALFADRVGSGAMTTDSLSLERMLGVDFAQRRIQAWHDTIVAHRAELPPERVDSLYRLGVAGLFQHILISATGPTAADTAKAKAQADKLVPQAKAGNFAKLAMQFSGDAQSKADSGYLPPGPKGIFVPEFETAAWALTPGAVSGVVRSQFGFHIIRRPPLEEIRPRFTGWIKQHLAASEDSVYMTQLAASYDLTVKPGVVAAMRGGLTDLAAARKSNKELVSFKNGSFTVGDMAYWLGAFPLPQLTQFKNSNDTVLSGVAKLLAQNKILLRQADSAKVTVDRAVYQGLVLQFKSQLAEIRQVMGLDAPEFSDSSKLSSSRRRDLAHQKVETYFDKLTKGEAQFRPVPPMLAADLRAQGDFKVYQAGISHAKELVLAQKRKDSAAAASQPPPLAPGTLQQAPGGPPRPAAPADTSKKP